MAITLKNLEQDTLVALQYFWHSRGLARKKQAALGRSDQGERAGVTAGKNMQGFADLITRVVLANGLPPTSIQVSRRLQTLPGYFRPTKIWDILVMHRGLLVAAIELKSQVGPSFGNNFNNRAEESIGSAMDLWTAYREGAIRSSARPFVGWLMLLEDCEASRLPVREQIQQFPVLPEFINSSYASRYDILCQKMMLEQLYSSAALVLSTRPSKLLEKSTYRNYSDTTSLHTFASVLAGHVASVVAINP